MKSTLEVGRVYRLKYGLYSTSFQAELVIEPDQDVLLCGTVDDLARVEEVRSKRQHYVFIGELEKAVA